MSAELVDGFCQPCRTGRHVDCRQDLACLCWGRWDADERSIVLCESLMKETP